MYFAAVRIRPLCCFALFASLWLAPSLSSIAQNSLDLRFGFSHVLSDVLLPFYAGSPGCGTFGKGAGSLLHVEIGATFAPPFIHNLDLCGGVEWSGESLLFSADPLSPFWTFDPVSVADVEIPRRFDRELSWNRIGLNLVARYRLFHALSIGAGVSPGIRFGLTSRQTENLTGGGDFTFDDGTKSREMSGDEPLQLAPVSLGILGTLGYRVPVSSLLSIEMEGDFRYEVLSPFQLHEGREWSAGGRVGLSLHLDRSKKEDTVPTLADRLPAPRDLPLIDTIGHASPVQVVPPHRSNLSAEIDMYTLDDAGERGDTVRLIIDDVTYIERNLLSTSTAIRREGKATPPTVQIDPSYQAEAGLKSWEIVLRYNDSVIARHTSEDSDEEGERQPDWRGIGEGAGSGVERLKGAFTVQDSTGEEKTAYAELPVATVRKERIALHEFDTLSRKERWLCTLPTNPEVDEAGGSYLNTSLREIVAPLRRGGTIRLLSSSTADATERELIARTLRSLLEERGLPSSSLALSPLDSETLRLLREIPDVSTVEFGWVLLLIP